MTREMAIFVTLLLFAFAEAVIILVLMKRLRKAGRRYRFRENLHEMLRVTEREEMRR
jgi:chorismate-pyruvate lyase